MCIIYNLFYILAAIIYLPVFLWRRKFHPGFSSRLGRLPKGLNLGQPIWIHAVSVGEAKAVKGLFEELKKKYPGRNFVISTVTPTGNKIARGIAGDKDLVTYLPLDLSFIVRRVLNKVKPCLFILAETEIWPNLIQCLYQKRIPVLVVNGRISDASFKGYRLAAFLLKAILNKISLFCAQTQRDADRLICLGVLRDKIRITGNMKFDAHTYPDFKKDGAGLRVKLGIQPQEKIWVAGSSHPGEEEIVLGAHQRLLRDFPDLRLVIAPRHPDRAKDIEKISRTRGFPSIFISKLNFGLSLTPLPVPVLPAGKRQAGNTYNLKPVFILDTIGQLMSFYALSDIVFVGGSLVRNGGHNILEPAALGKPILFGPHMFNFSDIADLFLENKAALLVKDGEGLCLKIKQLLNSPEEIERLSGRARALVSAHQGATQKTAQIIEGLCKNISTI